MREPKTFAQAQVMLKELGQWKDRISSKNQDLNGLKIQNAGDATEPQDYVTLSQLQTIITPVSNPNQNYSIPFSSVGAVSVGQVSAPFIVGTDRVGNPTSISVGVPSTTQAPVGVPLIVNLALNGVNMLATNLELAVGAEGPVFSSQFIKPLPVLLTGAKLVPVIIQAGGASFVTIQLYIVRIMT